MWRRQHARVAQQAVAHGRLDAEHVEARRRELSGLEPIRQRILVDDLAAARVDQHRTGSNLRQHLARVEPARHLRLRQVQRQHLRALEHLVHRDRRDVVRLVELGIIANVASEDLAIEWLQDAHDLLADVAAAVQADCAPRQ